MDMEYMTNYSDFSNVMEYCAVKPTIFRFAVVSEANKVLPFKFSAKGLSFISDLMPVSFAHRHISGILLTLILFLNFATDKIYLLGCSA